MNKKRIVDLTLPLDEKVANYSREVKKTVESDGWNASMLHIYSHTGTHMDCPDHFGVSGITVDRLNPERFFAEGILIRIPEVKPGMSISRSVLDTYHPKQLKGKAVLIQTGWSKFYAEPEIYRNRLPKISEELARYLVESGVSMLGVEPPSVSDVNNLQELTRVHRILLEGDVIIIEGLTNLDELSGKPFQFIALPLKIAAGDGAPVRAVAIEPEDA